jgi:hypothetical protein
MTQRIVAGDRFGKGRAAERPRREAARPASVPIGRLSFLLSDAFSTVNPGHLKML